jgi:hypothetical protein
MESSEHVQPFFSRSPVEGREESRRVVSMVQDTMVKLTRQLTKTVYLWNFPN